jgi:Transposase DDE domain
MGESRGPGSLKEPGFRRSPMRVNLRNFPLIMAASDRINTSTAFPKHAVFNRWNAGEGCFLAECPLSIEVVIHREAVVFMVEPIKIFVFISNRLGISFAFCYVMSKTPSKPFLLEDLSCRLSVLTTEEQGMLQKIEHVLPQEQLLTLARQSGAIQRQRKINPMSFLGAFCLLALHGSCSLRLAAMFTGILGGCVLSKQALAQHISEFWVHFFRRVLGSTLARAAIPAESKATGIFNCFIRVLVNDSTKLALPPKLAPYFPGSGNQTRKKNAMISLQTILDLLSETYIHFKITPSTYNDQRAASDILDLISPGDLIIRDLGYFVPWVFRTIIDKLAYFLSRYHHGTHLFDTIGKKLDLPALLNKTPYLDMWLYLGKEARVPVRLVAIPVPDKVANERRRKLLKNKKRDRRLNPGKEQLALCGWEIFITNVPVHTWTIQDVSNAYGLRWRIEIIFKAWKSHFNFTELTNGCKNYVLILIYTRLIFITLFQVAFVRFDRWIDINGQGTHLSLLKFAQFFALFLIMALGSVIVSSGLLMNQILKHCVYEKRPKRLTYGDLKQFLLS